jgi:hypothetical protein
VRREGRGERGESESEGEERGGSKRECERERGLQLTT